MNVADLEAALPALTVSILSELEDEDAVLVADTWEAVPRTDLSVLWAFQEEGPAPDAGGIGRPMHGVRYRVTIRDGSASQPARRTWVPEFRAGLHQRRRPFIAGLDHAQVLSAKVGPDEEQQVGIPGGTGGAMAQFDVLFVGDVLRDDSAETFLPTRLGDLVLWLDANDEATLTRDENDLVSAWADKSGNHFALTQGVNAQKPVWTEERQNERPGVVFSRASAQRLVANVAPITAAPFTAFVVARSADILNMQAILQLVGAVAGENFGLYFAGRLGGDQPILLRAETVADGAADAETDIEYLADTACVITALVVSSTSRSIKKGGENVGLGGSSFPRVPTVSQAVLGALLAGTDALDGDVYEVLVFARDLTSDERSDVEGYLSEKWGTA